MRRQQMQNRPSEHRDEPWRGGHNPGGEGFEGQDRGYEFEGPEGDTGGYEPGRGRAGRGGNWGDDRRFMQPYRDTEDFGGMGPQRGGNWQMGEDVSRRSGSYRGNYGSSYSGRGQGGGYDGRGSDHRQGPDSYSGRGGYGSGQVGYGQGGYDQGGHGPGGYDPSRFGPQDFSQPAFGQGAGGQQSGYGTQQGGYGEGYGAQGRRGTQGRGPKGYSRSDERIKEDVCERLSRGDIDASDVTVEVQNGCVTLEGTVRDRGTKHRIEDLSDSVSGVRDVDNRLRLNPGDESEERPRSGNGNRTGSASSSSASAGSSTSGSGSSKPNPRHS